LKSILNTLSKVFSPSLTLSNGYVADDHLNFYILHCLMHLRNWRSQRLQIWLNVHCASHSLRTTNCTPW